MRNGLFLSVFILLAFSDGLAQPYTSPFNNETTRCNSKTYRFIVSGHFYGSSQSKSGFPASTILGNLDTINNSGASFLLSLGDLFTSLDPTLIQNYRRSLFRNLKIPLINVPGNHDLMSGDYFSLFGPTYGYFFCSGDLFLLLDTEEDNGSIKGGQLIMIKEALSKLQEGQRIFIASHRTIWTEGFPELDGVFTDNTRSLSAGNFLSDILPLLRDSSRSADIYWFSGSLGSAPASFFYHKSGKLHLIATAVRDLPRDAFLMVNVSRDSVYFETVSLTGQTPGPLEQYNAQYWIKSKGKEEPFNYRLIPYLVQQTLLSGAFWIGFFVAVFVVLLIFLLKRFRR